MATLSVSHKVLNMQNSPCTQLGRGCTTTIASPQQRHAREGFSAGRLDYVVPLSCLPSDRRSACDAGSDRCAAKTVSGYDPRSCTQISSNTLKQRWTAAQMAAEHKYHPSCRADSQGGYGSGRLACLDEDYSAVECQEAPQSNLQALHQVLRALDSFQAPSDHLSREVCSKLKQLTGGRPLHRDCHPLLGPARDAHIPRLGQNAGLQTGTGGWRAGASRAFCNSGQTPAGRGHRSAGRGLAAELNSLQESIGFMPSASDTSRFPAEACRALVVREPEAQPSAGYERLRAPCVGQREDPDPTFLVDAVGEWRRRRHNVSCSAPGATCVAARQLTVYTLMRRRQGPGSYEWLQAFGRHFTCGSKASDYTRGFGVYATPDEAAAAGSATDDGPAGPCCECVVVKCIASGIGYMKRSRLFVPELRPICILDFVVRQC